jgi:RNA polymerase sigma factor (sigma-70 family)
MEEVKKELSAYKHNKKLLEKMEEEIEEYRNKATSCTSVLSDMPKGTGIHDKMAQYASIIADIEAEKINQLIELEKSKQVIENTISKLEQPYRNIIHYKFIDSMTLEDIAPEVPCSERQIYRLYKKALQEYKKIKDGIKCH